MSTCHEAREAGSEVRFDHMDSDRDILVSNATIPASKRFFHRSVETKCIVSQVFELGGVLWAENDRLTSVRCGQAVHRKTVLELCIAILNESHGVSKELLLAFFLVKMSSGEGRLELPTLE